MPRHSRKTETCASAPDGAPAVARKPKRKGAVRKRPRAARQRGPARESSRRVAVPAQTAAQIRTQALTQVLFLPTRPRCALLTYAGPAQPRRTKRSIVTTAIDLPAVITLPYVPFLSTSDRAAEQERMSAVADRHLPARDCRAAVTAIGALGGAWRWAKARAAAAPRSVMRSLRNRILLSVPQLLTIDPHTVAIIAVWSAVISGALVTGVLMHARIELLKTETLIARQMPQLAHPPSAAIENRANSKRKSRKAVQDNALIESWIEPGRTIPAEQPPRASADVRIIDAPAPMKRNCYEQTWPYIAAHCLAAAEDGASAAADDPAVAAAAPPQSPAIDNAYAAAQAQPAPSVRAAQMKDNNVKENEVTESTDRHVRSERSLKASVHRVVASASEDDSSPMPEKHKPSGTRHAHYAFEQHRDRAQSVARSLPVRESVTRSLAVRENFFVSGPPPYLSFNAY